VFDALVIGPTVSDLTAEGFLVPARIFAPAVPPDLRGIRTRAGDYDPAALSDLMGTAQMVEAVAAHYRLHVGDRSAVLFAASTRHADALAAGLSESGIASKAVAATTPAAERQNALSGLANGSVRIVCSCDLISEGLDVPEIAALILLRPTKSLALYLQQVGRGLRPAPGKHELIVLDHAGNSLAHGHPDAPRRWSLHGAGAVRGRKPRGVAEFCPHCASVIRRARPACRSCGTPLAPAEQPESSPAAPLHEVSGGAHESAVHSRPVADLIRDARTIDDLAAIQRARGFKPGWVWHKWQAIAGHRDPPAPSARPPQRPRRRQRGARASAGQPANSASAGSDTSM
jgi:superfamily II DNA or RNA helicase